MRVLHVGFGYTPFRAGGLIEYAEDLMAAQVARGDTVAFFNAGRRYLWFRRPRLWRWRRNDVEMYEIINSPLVLDEFGSKDPALDMHEPYTEGYLREVLSAFRPDVIHIQELCSLPSSVIEVVHQSATASVMTLQDYLPLCPTFRLYDYLGQVCLQRDVGHKCVPCCSALSGNPRHIMNITGFYDLGRFFPPPVVRLLWRSKALLRPITRGLHRLLAQRRRAPVGGADNAGRDSAAADLFQQRRETAIRRLEMIDVLVAQSTRVEEIYRTLGVTSDRLRTLHLTVNHLQGVNSRPRTSIDAPVTFVTMNGCATVEKGALLLIDAIDILKRELPPRSFRLLIFGGMMDKARALLRHPEVEYRGFYRPDELNRILEEADVGIIPSIWEEAYGYIGVEMLAKGVPVIGNKRGGIVDYVKPGLTGWINSESTGAGLAAIMRDIIEDPAVVVRLNASIRAQQSDILKTMSQHVEEMAAIYDQARRRRAGADVKTAA